MLFNNLPICITFLVVDGSEEAEDHVDKEEDVTDGVYRQYVPLNRAAVFKRHSYWEGKCYPNDSEHQIEVRPALQEQATRIQPLRKILSLFIRRRIHIERDSEALLEQS